MSWYKGFDTVIAQQLPHLRVLHDEPMSGNTTFRIGGPARRMAFPASPEELAALLNLATEEGWPWMVAGNGSDLLVDDAGLDLLVIVTTAMDQMERTGETTIRAWAGISLARLAVFAMEQGLAGLAFAHGIPGSLGGAVFMNAGAYGGEMCQVVDAVTASKAKIAELEASKPAREEEPVVEVSMQKKCPICGAESDSKFCPHCGAPMGE